jgi:SAM-dependent methyltransferase
MNARLASSAEAARLAIQRGLHEPAAFRAALMDVPPTERDAWVDLVLGIDDLPADGPSLPAGGVPYLPCSVDVLLRVVDEAPVGPSDVFVDVGAGLGRATMLVHLLTGAGAVGLEIQPELARSARDLSARLGLARVPCVEGDAARLTAFMVTGSVFFLYCPFGGARLAKVLDDLEAIARTRPLSVCCVDLPLPPTPWLVRTTDPSDSLQIHRSTLPAALVSRRCPGPAARGP